MANIIGKSIKNRKIKAVFIKACDGCSIDEMREANDKDGNEIYVHFVDETLHSRGNQYPMCNGKCGYACSIACQIDHDHGEGDTGPYAGR